MKFARIFSDFVENAEKRCNFSKFLDFNLIFITIMPEIYLIFEFFGKIVRPMRVKKENILYLDSFVNKS